MSALLIAGRAASSIPRLTATDALADVLIRDGCIESIGTGLDDPAGRSASTPWARSSRLGFIDMHVHLREPGIEHAETIETGARRGGRMRVHQHLLHAEHASGE